MDTDFNVSDEEQVIQEVVDTVSAGLMNRVTEPSRKPKNKVTIVGTGIVGMACAVSLLAQNITSEIALVDVMEDRAKGEMMDLQQAACLIGSPKIEAGSDFAISADSRVCVVTAGERQQPGESRLALVQRNLGIFKNIITQLVTHSADCVLIIVTNPVDIQTYVAWKLSGLPAHRVIGSGTNLDSSRLRVLVSQRLDLAADCCHGWVIGEQGDSSVAVWSGVNVAGVRLPRHPFGKEYFTPEGEPDCFSLMHSQVVNSAYEVIRLKGSTSWAVGLSVADLCQAVLNNVRSVHAVSTSVKGFHGIHRDVFLSLPCVLGESGVSHVIMQPLKEDERQKLKASADAVHDVIKDLQI